MPIPSGKSIKERGDVAQVIVAQLVTAILGVRKLTHLIGDPATRRGVEREVIISVRPMSELLGSAPKTEDELITEAVKKANTEAEFPELGITREPTKSKKA